MKLPFNPGPSLTPRDPVPWIRWQTDKNFNGDTKEKFLLSHHNEVSWHMKIKKNKWGKWIIHAWHARANSFFWQPCQICVFTQLTAHILPSGGGPKCQTVDDSVTALNKRSVALPSVNCVLYTITLAPGLSSNSTRFWLSALTMTSDACQHTHKHTLLQTQQIHKVSVLQQLSLKDVISLNSVKGFRLTYVVVWKQTEWENVSSFTN